MEAIKIFEKKENLERTQRGTHPNGANLRFVYMEKSDENIG